MQSEYVVMSILLMGVICQTILIGLQTYRLRDWKHRAIIAETECKQMAEIYGPNKKVRTL